MILKLSAYKVIWYHVDWCNSASTSEVWTSAIFECLWSYGINIMASMSLSVAWSFCWI